MMNVFVYYKFGIKSTRASRRVNCAATYQCTQSGSNANENLADNSKDCCRKKGGDELLMFRGGLVRRG